MNKLSEFCNPSLEVWIMEKIKKKWEKSLETREFLPNKGTVLQSSSNIYSIWHHFQPVLQFSSSWQVHKSCWDVSFLASFWSGTHWYLSLGGVWMWNFQHVKFDLVVCLSDTNRSLKFNWAWYGMGCPYGTNGVKTVLQSTGFCRLHLG